MCFCSWEPSVSHSGTGIQALRLPHSSFRLYADLFSCCQNTSHQIKFSLSGQQRLSRRQCGGIGLSPILPMSLLVSVTQTWIGHRCKGYRTCQIIDSRAVAEYISCWKIPQCNFNKTLWKWWRLIILKTCANKNQARARDASAQNSIREWKSIFARERFYSVCTNGLWWALARPSIHTQLLNARSLVKLTLEAWTE